MMDKNCMMISIDAEKAFDQIQQFMIKTLNKVGTEGMYFNIIKARYDKSTANCILSDCKLKVLPLRSEMRQCLLLPHIRSLARPIRQEKQTRHSNQRWRSETVSICR